MPAFTDMFPNTFTKVGHSCGARFLMLPRFSGSFVTSLGAIQGQHFCGQLCEIGLGLNRVLRACKDWLFRMPGMATFWGFRILGCGKAKRKTGSGKTGCGKTLEDPSMDY
jgi:hypothetical protein